MFQIIVGLWEYAHHLGIYFGHYAILGNDFRSPKRLHGDLDVFRLDSDQWAKKTNAVDRGMHVYNIKDFYNFEGQFPQLQTFFKIQVVM